MTRYLLDPNHLADTVRRVSRVRDRIRRLYLAGDRFGTCGPVLCELEVGMQQTARPEASRRRLNRLLNDVRLWPIDPAVAEVYAPFTWNSDGPAGPCRRLTGCSPPFPAICN